LKKNIFLTGCRGQDGQILSSILQKRKINLFLISRKKKNTKNNRKIISIDLKNKQEILKLFSKKKPDIVIHLAANNPSYNEKNKNKFYKENIIITKNLFDSVFETNLNAKFIFCSSSQIFKKKIGIVNEKSSVRYNSDYTKFRIESDRYMRSFKKKKGINYTNAILFNHDSIYRNKKFILPRLTSAILKKNYRFIKKMLKENIYADFSHAEDICNGLVKLIFSNINFDKIIFSSGKLTSLNLIIYQLLRKNKIDTKIFKKYFKKKKLNIVGDNRTAINKLNWKIKKNIFLASNELFDFYRKNV